MKLIISNERMEKKEYIKPQTEKIEPPELLDYTGKWSGEEGGEYGNAKRNNDWSNWEEEENSGEWPKWKNNLWDD